MDLTKLAEVFRARGFIATPRTWVMGETVFVSHHSLCVGPSGIAYRDSAYVREDADGTWTVYYDSSDKTLPDLDAVLGTLQKRWGLDPAEGHVPSDMTPFNLKIATPTFEVELVRKDGKLTLVAANPENTIPFFIAVGLGHVRRESEWIVNEKITVFLEANDLFAILTALPHMLALS